MLRASIITKVREKLDEVTPFDNAIVDDVDLIEKLLDGAAITILQTLPLNMLRGYKIPTAGYTEVMDDGTKGIGILPLPENFLRLQAIKVTGWAKVVTRAYDDTSHMAELQKSKVTRGGFTKPVCVISWVESSTSDALYGLDDISAGFYYEKVLKLYTVPDKAVLEVCSYIPRLLPEQLITSLIDPLAWQCAGDVCYVTGNQAQGKMCYDQVQKIINDNLL